MKKFFFWRTNASHLKNLHSFILQLYLVLLKMLNYLIWSKHKHYSQYKTNPTERFQCASGKPTGVSKYLRKNFFTILQQSIDTKVNDTFDPLLSPNKYSQIKTQSSQFIQFTSKCFPRKSQLQLFLMWNRGMAYRIIYNEVSRTQRGSYTQKNS